MQYLGKTNCDYIVLSDGKKTTNAKLSTKYNYLFAKDVISLYDVLTIYEIQREKSGSKTVFVDNISRDKSLQIGVKIGNPVPL